MKSISVHPPQELHTLARLIRKDTASWRGVACYCLQPLGENGDAGTPPLIRMLPDVSLCFERADGALIYLGKPLENLSELPAKVEAMVADIAAYSQPALAMLQEPPENEIPSRVNAKTSVSVLFADDDPLTRKLAEKFLSKHVNTLTVENPRTAAANYAVLRPDIVFLDIHYHEDVRDGFDVLRGILGCDPQAYVVIISGDSAPATIYKSLKEGAQGFIAKPLRAEDFYSHIAK